MHKEYILVQMSAFIWIKTQMYIKKHLNASEYYYGINRHYSTCSSLMAFCADSGFWY